jgi:hypothetical protein
LRGFSDFLTTTKAVFHSYKTKDGQLQRKPDTEVEIESNIKKTNGAKNYSFIYPVGYI